MASSKFQGFFFLHHAFPSLYNINFMVCSIMWACLSVIIEYFKANRCAYVRYGWIEITYAKANHCVAFLFVNAVELGLLGTSFVFFHELILVFDLISRKNFLYNLLLYSCQSRLAVVYRSAAWFIFKICLVVFEGNMLLS